MKKIFSLVVLLISMFINVNAQIGGEDMGKYTAELKNYINQLKENRTINSALADSAQKKHIITYLWWLLNQNLISDNFDGVANLWEDTKVFRYSGNEKYRVLSSASADVYSGIGTVNSAIIISNRNLAHIVSYVCDYHSKQGVLLLWSITGGEIKFSKYFYSNLEKINSTNNELWYQLSSYGYNIIATNGDILRSVTMPIDPTTFIFERFEQKWHN